MAFYPKFLFSVVTGSLERRPGPHFVLEPFFSSIRELIDGPFRCSHSTFAGFLQNSFYSYCGGGDFRLAGPARSQTTTLWLVHNGQAMLKKEENQSGNGKSLRKLCERVFILILLPPFRYFRVRW